MHPFSPSTFPDFCKKSIPGFLTCEKSRGVGGVGGVGGWGSINSLSPHTPHTPPSSHLSPHSPPVREKFGYCVHLLK
ncbi:MAG: hypothetical protein RMY28_018455 [Nostoc sp. ChiSLP01]